MISYCKHLFVILFVFLVLTACFNSEHYVVAQTDQTATKLQAVNINVGRAFNAVLDAEKVGGNITQLLARLNIAGDFLSKAQSAYNSGNNSIVTSMTEKASQIADQVKSDAVNLRNVRIVESQNSFWLVLFFSIIGAVLFCVSLLIIWRRFKRSYIKKLLGTKPEVVENAP